MSITTNQRKLGEQSRQMAEMRRTINRVVNSTTNEKKEIIDMTGVNTDDEDDRDNDSNLGK
jgi:hypothetical protein